MFITTVEPVRILFKNFFHIKHTPSIQEIVNLIFLIFLDTKKFVFIFFGYKIISISRTQLAISRTNHIEV